jgi:hypothetical protein
MRSRGVPKATLAQLLSRFSLGPLRAEFGEFRIDRMEDGVIGILPVLRPQPTEPFGGYAAWVEAGKPLPSADEARRIQRHYDLLEEGMW